LHLARIIESQLPLVQPPRPNGKDEHRGECGNQCRMAEKATDTFTGELSTE
jgi:hypothetical protein